MDMIERAARAIAANKRGWPSDHLDLDRVSTAYFGQARAAIEAAFTIPANPSDADRQRYQALCDELDRMGYRPTGWVDPPRLDAAE